MDIQQILSIVIVAAAAVFIAVRLVRRRRTGKFRECADCVQAGEHARGNIAGKK